MENNQPDSSTRRPFLVCMAIQLSHDFNKTKFNFEAEQFKGYCLVYARTKEDAVISYLTTIFDLKDGTINKGLLYNILWTFFGHCIMGDYHKIEPYFKNPTIMKMARTAGENYSRRHPKKYIKNPNGEKQFNEDKYKIEDAVNELLEEESFEDFWKYASGKECVDFLFSYSADLVSVIDLVKIDSHKRP